MKTGDKVMFRLGDGKSVFTVIDVQSAYAKIEPGIYGDKDMIVEVDRLEEAK